MSKTIDLNASTNNNIPNSEANAAPEMTAEEVQRLLKAAPKREFDNQKMKEFDDYINDKFLQKGYGVASEISDGAKAYYLWDKDFQHIHKVANTHNGEAMYQPKEATGVLSLLNIEANSPYKENVFRTQVEEKTLWDRFCGFFGYKTAHVKKIERAEQLNAMKSKAFAHAIVQKEYGVDADFLKPTKEEEAVLSLTGDGLQTYLKTGTVPSATPSATLSATPSATSSSGDMTSENTEPENTENEIEQGAPEGQVDPVVRLFDRIKEDESIEIDFAVHHDMRNDLVALRERGRDSTTVKNMGIYLCGLEGEALRGFVEMYKNEHRSGKTFLLRTWASEVTKPDADTETLVAGLTNEIKKYTKPQPQPQPQPETETPGFTPA